MSGMAEQLGLATMTSPYGSPSAELVIYENLDDIATGKECNWMSAVAQLSIGLFADKRAGHLIRSRPPLVDPVAAFASDLLAATTVATLGADRAGSSCSQNRSTTQPRL